MMSLRLLAVPFLIVARACKPTVHSASRLEQGEKHEKRLGTGEKKVFLFLFPRLPTPLHLFFQVSRFRSVTSRAVVTV